MHLGTKNVETRPGQGRETLAESQAIGSASRSQGIHDRELLRSLGQGNLNLLEASPESSVVLGETGQLVFLALLVDRQTHALPEKLSRHPVHGLRLPGKTRLRLDDRGILDALKAEPENHRVYATIVRVVPPQLVPSQFRARKPSRPVARGSLGRQPAVADCELGQVVRDLSLYLQNARPQLEPIGGAQSRRQAGKKQNRQESREVMIHCKGFPIGFT